MAFPVSRLADRSHACFSADAGVAHLVERHLAKVEVASSSLVTRSIFLYGTVAKW